MDVDGNCSRLKDAMKREHGYWAWESAHGIPWATSPLTFSAFKQGIPNPEGPTEGTTITVVL
jgi:hypothetical protein